MKKAAIWFYMCTKRLLLRKSFVILLCLIPIMVALLNGVMLGKDSGILKIALCNEGDEQLTGQVIENLKNGSSLIRFCDVSDYEEAKKLVETKKVDSAWIFLPGLEENIDGFVSEKDKKPIVKIIEREESATLLLSKEVLFGALYNEISYSALENFVLVEEGLDGKVEEHTLREKYESAKRRGKIVENETLSDSVREAEQNIITAPLRGILAVLMVLCTLAAAMFYLRDKEENRYAWMTPGKRKIPALAMCASASVITGVTVFAAILIAGMSEGLLTEALSMLLFVFALTGFGYFACTVFRSPGKLGAILPGLVIAMLVVAPIFFEFGGLEFAKKLSPVNYYLNSVYYPEYRAKMLAYGAAIYLLATIADLFLNRKPDKAVG